jgi:hypothetical protein
MLLTGILAKSFAVEKAISNANVVDVSAEPHILSESFGLGDRTSVFQNSRLR